MPSEIVVVDGVGKQYGDRVALRDLRFSLRAGESVGYLGPNGAGKTTTLKILAGISRPSNGVVRIRGLDPSVDRTRALRNVGALVETPGVPPYLTADDLLDHVARVHGVPLGDRAAAIRRSAESLGVGDHLRRPFGSLSTGLGRRVLLAAALVGEPELLLLDEPTLGLDPAARHDLRDTLRRLSGTGLTMLVSTHLLEDVEQVCDRVLFLRSGTVVGDESVHLEATGSSGDRSLRLAFALPVSEEQIQTAAGTGAVVTSLLAREVMVRFSGGDAAQAELLARLVRAGLPLLQASPPESDLARRYFEKVGREDAT
ncbi:MAG TPA: ABC transporter ATP-binding protein [Thermoplasmata archaeon]|nr:ABC transporter ATP-binding protein [Thermoplasmata archaeon]